MADVFRTPEERFADLPGYDFEPHYADVDERVVAMLAGA
jgi:haloalkane dehalogenase